MKGKAAMSHDAVAVKVYTEKIENLVHSNQNPRLIKNKKHKELVQSLKDFPEMKNIREIVIDENNIILGGDKRVYALEEIGVVDVVVKKVTGLTDRQKREFIAKDNLHSGEWDTNVIASSWDIEELKSWGAPDFKMPSLEQGNSSKQKKEEQPIECPHCGAEFFLNK